MNICSRPDVLEVMYILNIIVSIAKVIVPIIIIITGMISFFKVVTSDNDYKDAAQVLITKVIVGAFVFFVPSFVYAVISLVDPTDFSLCFKNATKQNINNAKVKAATDAVLEAERTQNKAEYDTAMGFVAYLDSGTVKTNLNSRLDAVNKTIAENAKKKQEENDKIYEENIETANKGKELEYTGDYAVGSGSCKKGVAVTSEPSPLDAISCWPNVLNPNDFVFKKDANGKSLGSWPKNYESIPTQLTSYKTYGGTYIWPVTPTGGVYNHVYDHTSIDIMAPFGTPIYSPVDGTLTYSEWGHTSNKGGDETQYSISIAVSNPINVGGKRITTIFMTHMSGLRYRCARNQCNKMVKKGELLGFVGNAAGSTESVGWAPHLHMTFYAADGSAIQTAPVEQLYNVSSGQSIVAGG